MACTDPNFVPQIDLCINNSCDTICLKELTDRRQPPYNMTGWGDINPETEDVLTAIVTIHSEDGSELLDTITIKDTEEDIDLYPNSTPSPFVIDDISWEYSDGVYQVVYRVTTSEQEYNNGGQYVLFICSIKNCLELLTEEILLECDRKALVEKKELRDQLELIVFGIESAFGCDDFDTVDNLINVAHKLCGNRCNTCNCK